MQLKSGAATSEMRKSMEDGNVNNWGTVILTHPAQKANMRQAAEDLLESNQISEVNRQAKAIAVELKKVEEGVLCEQLIDIGKECLAAAEDSAHHFDKLTSKWRLRTLPMIKAAYNRLVPSASKTKPQPKSKDIFIQILAPHLKRRFI